MGEVYRAWDAKLAREVAVKVLPGHLAENQEALARFEREARALAALSHPNILDIHDFGSGDGLAFAVTELLDGESLRARLALGALPQRKAVEYALQIVLGLAAAHEKGIVHRDLKPENLFLTKDGRVKILDFGLARQDPLLTGDDDSNSPTLAHRTVPGALIGTVGYMSPEQVRGQPADHRADIFAFGAVFFEMLAGRRAFQSETAAETMTAILRGEPRDPSELNPSVPSALDRIVQRCLEKAPEQRFHSAHDLAFAIEAVSGSSRGVASMGPLTSSPLLRGRLAVLSALVAGAVLGAASSLLRSHVPAEQEPTRLGYLTYSGFDSSPAASPDGRTIAFTSSRDGQPRIWVKQVQGGGEAALTTGPDDYARFSPDGSGVLFVRTEPAGTSLYRTAVVGGELRRVVEDALFGDWSPDGKQVVFLRWKSEGQQRNSIFGIAGADGENAREIARVEGQSLRHPRWSPDGAWIAAVSGGFQTGRTPATIFLISPDARRRRSLSPPVGNGFLSAIAWVEGGQEVIYAQAESEIADNTAAPARVVRQDLSSSRTRTLLWSPSNARVLDILGAGRLVYDVRSGRENLLEITLGRKGSPREQRWASRGNSTDRQPFYSPDGEWVLFTSNRSGNFDVWDFSTKTGAVHRLTDNDAEDADPAVSSDGRTLLWASNRTGHFEVWAAERDGSRPRQLTNDGFDAENPTATPDGRWIVYASTHPEKLGVWRIQPDGSEAKQLVAGTVILPEVSPDGRYVLYVADPGSQQPSVRVARIADGAAVPFEISIVPRKNTPAVLGRARWLPDGRAIAFVGQDAGGVNGVFVQDFVPGQDSSRTRRPLGGFDAEAAVESFGLSRDGSRLMVAAWEQLFSLALAEGVSGVSPPRRSR
jgi:serine/threonine protein kinase